MGNGPTLHSIVLNNPSFNSAPLRRWLMGVNCRRVRALLDDANNPTVMRLRGAYIDARNSAALAAAVRSTPGEWTPRDADFIDNVEFLEEQVFIAEAEMADAEFDALQDEIEKRG